MLNEQFFLYNPNGFDHLKPIMKRHSVNSYLIEYIIKNSDIGCTRVLRGPFTLANRSGCPLGIVDPKKDPY